MKEWVTLNKVLKTLKLVRNDGINTIFTFNCTIRDVLYKNIILKKVKVL